MLLTGMSNTLVTAAGDPIPPQSVVQRLKGTRFSVLWIPAVKCWQLRERWRNGDPRWEMVQTGKIPRDMACDVLQLFPEDCPGDEMAAFIEKYYGSGERTLTKGEAAKEADKRVDAAMQRNAKTMESNIQSVHQNSVERHERESRHDLRVRAGTEKAHPMVTVAQDLMK